MTAIEAMTMTMFNLAVRDVDASRAFYIDKLGFNVTTDSKDFNPGKDRWVSITPPTGGVTINLTNVFENVQPGTMKLYFATTDIETAHKELQARGIQLPAAVTDDPWARWFDFNDPDGNHWLVIQQKHQG